MHGRRFGGLRRRAVNRTLWLAFAAALVVAAPATAQDDARQPDTPSADVRPYDRDYAANVIDAGFGFVAAKYHRPVMMGEFTVAAVKGLAAIDRNLGVSTGNGTISLTYLGNDVGSFETPTDDDPEAWSALVVDILEVLRSDVRRFGQASSEELFEALFDGATATLDRASRYNSAAEASQARANRQGFGGIGVEIEVGFREVRVTSVFADSPADRAGIHVGDRITHVEGEPIANLSQEAIQGRLRGPLESKVKVSVRRPAGETDIVTLTRKRIIPPTVTAVLTDGIGEIKIERFNRGTARDVHRSYDRLIDEAGGALTGLILDLRFNPGGLLLQATEVADLFIVGGPISRSVGRVAEASARFIADDADITDGLPIVVLINARSASAAEVLAAAMQDRGRAVVVGSNSFGKGSVQSIYPLPNGGDIVLTWSLLQAPSGYFYDGLGVIPNLCTSNKGGVEVAGGGSLVPPDASLVMADFLDSEPAAFRSLLAAWRTVSDVDDDDRKLQLRRNCSPARGDHFLDLEIARQVIKDPQIYRRALRLSSTEPIAADDRLTVAEDETSQSLAAQLPNLLGNDQDLDGDPVRITAVNGSSDLVGSEIELESGALLTVSADGSVALSLDELKRNLAVGESITENLTYRIADEAGGLSSANIVIAIEGRNDAPLVDAVFGSVSEDAVLTVAADRGLLVKVRDPDSSALQIVSVNGLDTGVGETIELASGARLTVHADGAYEYDPAGQFDRLPAQATERDEFTFMVGDGDGGRSPGTAVIEIAGRNNAPLAGDDEVLVNEKIGQALDATFGLLANDVDPDDAQLRIVAVNGDSRAVGTALTLGRGLSVVVDADGSVTADPQRRYDRLALTETVVETLRYTVRDADDMRSEATVSFVIEGENDAPTVSDDVAETDHRTELRLSVDRLLANDGDVDGDRLEIVEIGGLAADAIEAGQLATTALGATLRIGAEGALIYDPTASQELAALPEGSAVADRFSYRVTDPHGAAAEATVTVRVSAPIPTISVQDDRYELPATAPLRVAADAGLLANDRVIAGERAEIVAVNGAAGIVGRIVETERGATLTVDADGAIIYNPNGAFDDLADGEKAVETVVYTVADTSGEQFDGRVAFTVVGVSTTDALGTDQDHPLAIDILSRVTDPDGDPLQLTRVEAGTDGVSLEIGADGVVTYDPNHHFDALKQGEEVADSFVYEVSDGRGGVATATVVLTVTGLNDLPQASDDRVTGVFGERLDVTAAQGLLANDHDVDGDRLAVIAVAADPGGRLAADAGAPLRLPSEAVVTVHADGSFSYQAPVLGPLRAANPDDVLHDAFTYTVADGQGGTATGRVVVTVVMPNRAPLAPDIGLSSDRAEQSDGG